ncbi:hypothetical protein BC943DRAFT_321970 [Umbelopsis sp. AD052]|nr:hypothetical protein BC943DRAFT_321970 [Umbelopsis sp. AD052]
MSTLQHFQEHDPYKLTSFHLDEPAVADTSENVISKLFNKVISVVGPEHSALQPHENTNAVSQRNSEEHASADRSPMSVKAGSIHGSFHGSVSRPFDETSVTDTVYSASTLPADMSRPSQLKATDLLNSFLSERTSNEDRPTSFQVHEKTMESPHDEANDSSSMPSQDHPNDDPHDSHGEDSDQTRDHSDEEEGHSPSKNRTLKFLEPSSLSTKAFQLERTASKDSDTQSIATTFSVSNTNSLRNVISRLRGHKSDKEFWMPDENCKECYTCGKSFTFLRRKHHCRICGQIFCAKCASHIISGKQFKQKGEVRVCKFCFENIDHNIMESNSAAALGTSPADTAIFDAFSPVVPDQKAPIAAPKLQISTTALKQSRDSYGAQNTPTVSVEFQNEFVAEKPIFEEDFPKTPDLLSPNDKPLMRQTHRLAEYDDHEPRPTRTESSSSIRPRLRSSTSGSFGSGDENAQAAMSQKASFPFRSELGSPALEAVPNRASSEFGGSPLIDKYEDENEDGGVAWNYMRNLSAVDLPPNAFAAYKLHEPGSPSAEKDVKGNEGAVIERPLYKYSDAGTKSKHKMNRRLTYNKDERKSVQGKGSPIWRNMKNMKVNTLNLTLPVSDPPLFEDPAPSEDQFMLFSPFHRSEQPNWPSPDLLLNNSRSPSQSAATSASNSIQMHSELSIASLDHLRKLLHTSLADLKYMQDNPTLLAKYENTLFDLVLEMVVSIKPDVRGGDDMDLRHYLKIKKIPGARPSDSHYVKGVVCSKNVAHKQMIRNIDDPRILILLFPVEYSRVGNQLLSIEPVLSQEKEHLKKLVARIIALKPSIVLTKYNVSRLAMEYLLAENIIVVHNMKKSVLQAIARCTGASLIPSIDKFPSGDISLGHCGRFEIKTLVHEMIPNRKKTYLVFDQCSAELGGTIVLRGADQLTLSSIKRIVDFMCYVANSLKLETFLLRDSFAKSKVRADPGNMGSNTETTRLRRASDSLLSLPSLLVSEAENTSQTPPLALDDTPPPTVYGLGITEVEQRHRSIDGSIEMYREALVSISPFVVIPPPYLLTKIKEVEVKILEMEHLMAQEEAKQDHVLTPGSTTPVCATFDQKQESNAISQAMVHVDFGTSPLKDELDLLLDQRHQMTRAWYASMPDMFSHLTAYHHQHLVVLYFNVCTATTVPCHGPEPLFFQYYNQNSDITLGHYLEDLCGNSQRICSSSMCERSEMLHYRSYVHGQARINVMIEKFECPQPGMNDIILMWSYCQRCNNPTPVVPMSQNTWNYSFGKFLELSLYQADVQCRADICPHDIARDHVRYFGFKDLAVRFQYDEIDLLEVAAPPMKLVMFTKVHSKLREDQYQGYRTKIVAFYQSIIERNKHFSMDILDPIKVDAAKKELLDMSENAAAEKKAMLQALQSVYATTYSTDILSLNQIVFHLFRSASAWDQAYSYLLRKYLPQDTDIGKIASSGLRKLLPSDKVIDIDARAERAIDTGDLPVLDVGLDSLPLSIASDAHFTHADEDNDINVVPALGTSPPLVGPQVADSETAQDNVVLPSRLARRLSIEFIRTENERAVAEEKQSKMMEASLPLIDPIPSSIMARRQAKGIPRRPGQLTDWKNRPSSIPSILTVTEHGIGSSIRRKEHPIFSVLQDTPILVNTPPDVNSPGQTANNHQMTGEVMKQYRDIGQRGSSDSRLPYSYLPRYADQLNKGSIRDIPKASRRKWGPKLERSRTSIQVYDTANDLVREDVEQEFGEDPVNAFGTTGDGATVSSRLGKIDPLLSSRLLAASQYGQVEPRTDYFGNARIRDGDRVVKTPDSPRSITNFSLEAASTDQPLTNHSDHQAPLSSSPTLAPPKENSNSDVPYLALTSSGASSPSLLKQQQIASLLDDHATGGSDQTIFMRALSTALAEIMFSKLPPLEYPFTQTDHIFPDSLVIVKEDVPSTIIAYTLSCEDYLEKLHTIHESHDEQSQASNGPDSLQQQQADSLELAPSQENTYASSHASGMEKTLLSDTGTHMRYQFSDGSTRFFCKVFFSEQFEALRQNCGFSEKYITSLASSVEWDSSGGKSGSAFLKTTDDRFLIKQMSRYEMDAFLRFAPAYFQYMSRAFFHELPTVLAKIFGFYSIGFKNAATGKSMRMDVLIMENLFYQRNVKKIFDLKGSMRNRHVQSTGKDNEVLLDENLVEFIYQSPLFIRSHAKETLRASLHNDTLFLYKLDVMDYSLLVGIDEEQQELVVGIVDFMRTFTWDKKLESWVKESGILGGGGKEPTIVSPKTYRIRFREAMERYFLMVPDFWASVEHSTIGQQHHHQ